MNAISEHLDFINSIEAEMDLRQFKQLEHDYIGYQSLTDVPKALSYNENIKDYSVSLMAQIIFGDKNFHT